MEILRITFALLFILLTPGFAFTYMLFPVHGKIDRLERFSIALFTGTAISSLLGFGLLKANINLNPTNFILSLSLITVILFSIGLFQVSQRNEVQLKKYIILIFKKLSINPLWILLVLTAISSIVLANLIFTNESVHLTEFYISPNWLEESGLIKIKEPVINVPVEINNLENAPTRYQIKVYFDGELIWESKEIILENNEIHKELIPVVPYNTAAPHLLIINLYKNSSENSVATLRIAVKQDKLQK